MKSVAVLLLFIGAAVSHTQMTKLTIGGKDRSDCLRANSNPNGYPYEQSPIMFQDFPSGITGVNYTCGYAPYSQKAAATTCDVTAGETVTLNFYHGASYTGETKDKDNWIAFSHYGPIMVFLAAADVEPAKAKWFKIWQESILSWNIDGSKSEWASAVYLNKNSGRVPVTIPSDLKAGKYYIRSELIALHSASERGGAQPYIRCGELNIVGGGSVSAADIDAVNGYTWTIPSNAYANLDSPGIKYNVWWNSPNPYPYPGGTMVYKAGAIKPNTPPPTQPPPPPPPAPVTPTPPPPAPTPSSSTTGDAYDGNVIKSGQYLKQGQKLWDTTKSYYARVKADGRLIIADKNKIIHWTSNNADGLNKGVYVLAPQKNGHLIVFQTNVDPWTIYWDAPVSYDADTDFSLRMQPDGNLVFQNSQGKTVWTSSLNIDLGAAPNSYADQTDNDEDPIVDPFATASSSSTNVVSMVIVAFALVALLF